MKLTRKLFRAVCILLVTALFVCVGSACVKEKPQEDLTIVSGFSVHIIDVGNGDCIFVRFHDGKNMLIDCGVPSKNNLANINKVLKSYSVTQIDYLVLTHPDVDHVGNAEAIVNTYNVNKAYIPNIYNLQEYQAFSKALTTLKNKNVQLEYSSIGSGVLNDKYVVAFLSPCASGAGDVYGEFNGIELPTDKQINNLSPVIYLEYAGIKFLFTGDAGKEQEGIIQSNYNSGLYDKFYNDRVNLDQIDFLKVGHHGAEDCSSQDFLNLIQPQNAIFSVGGNNIYGHPSSRVLDRLFVANENVSILRTDVSGNICISVSADGEYKIYK